MIASWERSRHAEERGGEGEASWLALDRCKVAAAWQAGREKGTRDLQIEGSLNEEGSSIVLM